MAKTDRAESRRAAGKRIFDPRGYRTNEDIRPNTGKLQIVSDFKHLNFEFVPLLIFIFIVAGSRMAVI